MGNFRLILNVKMVTEFASAYPKTLANFDRMGTTLQTFSINFDHVEPANQLYVVRFDYVRISILSFYPTLCEYMNCIRWKELPTTLLRLRITFYQGRNGKGSIFVWSTGNGGMIDNCAADGYVSSPYTLSIGSIDYLGVRTYFKERCPSTMAVIYTGESGR